ncbi:hypothetical protein Tco_1280022, partial [Tanacetum coccineum]
MRVKCSPSLHWELHALNTDLSFAGLDDFVYKTKVSETITIPSKTSEDSLEKPKAIRPSAPIIKDWDTDRKWNFVPTGVVTKSGQVPVNTAKQSCPRAATSISNAWPVNTDALKSKVNYALPKTFSYFKAHSLVRRAFNQKSVAKTNNLNEKVKTTRVNNVTTARPKAIVSAAVGNGENAIKLTQDQGIFDSGCSRHMTGNKCFLTDYQEVDGGFVAFAGSLKG